MKVASASGNLKGTFKRFLRDTAGSTRVCVTKMSKRNSTVGSETMLEQENIQLRARIQELETRCAKLEGNTGKEAEGPPPKTNKKQA